MIDVKKVEDFEKLTTALNGISEAIENMPTPTGGGVNYSTDEQDTGLLWIDGRHVYQRTFDKRTTPLLYHTWLYNVLGTSNIQIIELNGFFNVENSEPGIPLSYYRSSSEYITCTLNATASDIQIYSDVSGVNIYGGIITIRYVKVGE